MALILYQLKKEYVAPDATRVPVIDLPYLELRDGEQVAMMGTSGSGKTTLLHMIAGILTPDSGRITYDVASDDPANPRTRLDISSLTEAQRDIFRGRNIGYIFQTHHLLPGFTALENVLLGMSFTGRKHDHAWATHLLNQVGLFDRHDYRPGKLSVGQQQRVAVARALANRPKMVLADEPTGALDSINAQQVLELIRRLCNEVAATLLLVTHDAQIAAQLPRMLSLTDLNQAAKKSRPIVPASR